MARHVRQLITALLSLIGAWMLAAPAQAATGAGSEVCFAALSDAGTPAQALARVATWNCRPDSALLAAGRVAVRLAPLTDEGAPVRSMQAGIGQFDRLTIIAAGADGKTVVHTYTPEDVTPIAGRPHFAVALPSVAQAVVFHAVFDRPGNTYILQEVAPSAADLSVVSVDRFEALVMAVLIGMLAIPLLLDLGIYAAVRDKLFAWHGLLIANFILLLLCWSGLIVVMFGISMPQWHRLLMVSLALNGAVACLFNRSYYISGYKRQLFDRALAVGAAYSLLLGVLYAGGAFDGSARAASAYSMALLPVLALLTANLVLVVKNGNWLLRLQLIGWTPLLLFFVARFAANLLALQLPRGALPLLYLGVLILSVLSAIGVIVRFADMRRERDVAVARAEVMGGLAERDHLTGLLNRRAIDNRFGALRAKGYDTFALIDLDHFKAINDVSGHAVGDQVLEVSARVLASDPDNIAVRLGGEEFLLLLRGAGQAARAEKLRRMLSVRVAREIDGLEQIVTASMGLLTLPADCPEAMTFASVYSRADLLLYEAKREGRNRTKAAQIGFYAQCDNDDGWRDSPAAQERPVVA